MCAMSGLRVTNDDISQFGLPKSGLDKIERQEDLKTM